MLEPQIEQLNKISSLLESATNMDQQLQLQIQAELASIRHHIRQETSVHSPLPSPPPWRQKTDIDWQGNPYKGLQILASNGETVCAFERYYENSHEVYPNAQANIDFILKTIKEQ